MVTQEMVHALAKEKGWWDDVGSSSFAMIMDEKLMLVICEVAEFVEDVRAQRWELAFEPNGKPVGAPSELADARIRLMDLAGWLGVEVPKYDPEDGKRAKYLVRPTPRLALSEALNACKKVMKIADAIIARSMIDNGPNTPEDMGVLKGLMAECVQTLDDIALTSGVNLPEAIEKKHAFNTTRPYKHGKVI